jgi:plastocyanin
MKSLSNFSRSASSAALASALLVAALFVTGCGGGDKPKEVTKEQPTEKPPTPVEEEPAPEKETPEPEKEAPEPEKEAGKNLGTGTLKGKVVLKGTPLENKMLDMSTDDKKECEKLHEGKVSAGVVIVGDGGALKNAIVYISDGIDDEYSPPDQVATIDQKGCTYSPHIFAIMVGQKLKITNSDPFLHNIHSFPADDLNKTFNFGQKKGDELVEVLEEEELVQFKCDVHKWMSAYVRVFPHPYFAVTGADGSFEIKNVPAGKFTLSVWHEHYGNPYNADDETEELEQEVELGEGASKEGIAFTFEAK